MWGVQGWGGGCASRGHPGSQAPPLWVLCRLSDNDLSHMAYDGEPPQAYKREGRKGIQSLEKAPVISTSILWTEPGYTYMRGRLRNRCFHLESPVLH